jgi:preprotein translocase subunit SecF
LRGFSLALVIGIVVGTFSSIFIASPLLLAWEQRRTGWNTPHISLPTGGVR